MNEVRVRGPRVLVFDSGLGGLTVLAQVRKARPDAMLIYAADDAAFPYAALGESELVSRVASMMERLVADHAPDLVVIACSTASTLVLGPLRARFPALPFVGTVPAIKPAAAASKSRLISVLATTGTVARDYTQALVREYAGDCEVTLVGSRHLARLAEDWMRGLPVDEAEIAREIAPCFVEIPGRRTDFIALACRRGAWIILIRLRLSRVASMRCSGPPIEPVRPASLLLRPFSLAAERLGMLCRKPYGNSACPPCLSMRRRSHSGGLDERGPGRVL
jgi:glutamate racemase